MQQSKWVNLITCRFKQGDQMSWSTVYIRGRAGFQKVVISKLDTSWLQGSPETVGNLLMFWLPGNITLRDLKIAIGSKLILKYRLQFIINLNNYLLPEKDISTEFSASEKDMIDKMNRLDNEQQNPINTHEISNTVIITKRTLLSVATTSCLC